MRLEGTVEEVPVETVDEGAEARQEGPAATPTTLEAWIVDEIEDLHRQVMRHRAARAFGLRAASSATQTDVEGAEQALLTEHGFTSYDDFYRHTGGSQTGPHQRYRRAADVTEPGATNEPPPLSPQTPLSPARGDGVASVAAPSVQARAEGLIAKLDEESERRLALIRQRGSDELTVILRRAAEGRAAVHALIAAALSCPAEQPPAARPAASDDNGAREDTRALWRELGALSRGGAAASVQHPDSTAAPC
jgi:hypothetical protein